MLTGYVNVSSHIEVHCICEGVVVQAAVKHYAIVYIKF